MDELISRRAAIDALEDAEDAFGYLTRDWREVLMELPPAQPEIVRCKDCQHRDEYGCCKYWKALSVSVIPIATDDDEFCSYGERREVTE